jgi:hypothetical protein
MRSVKRECTVEEMDDALSAEIGSFKVQGIRGATSAQKYPNRNAFYYSNTLRTRPSNPEYV